MNKKLWIILLLGVRPVLCSEKPKALLLDLGGIFYDYSKIAHMQRLGLGTILSYAVLDRQNPAHLKKPIFDVMRNVKIERDPDLKPSRTTKGDEFPYILSLYQAGRITSDEALKKIMESFEELKQQNYFVSDRQEALVERALGTTFNPEAYAETIGPYTEGIQLLKKLARVAKENDILLIGLTNWDGESFPLVREKFKKDMELFDDLIASGEVGRSNRQKIFLKPNEAIFEHALEKHNLSKDEVLFIDDQQENIDAAKAFGIENSILFKGFPQIRRELTEQGVLPEEESTYGYYLLAFLVPAFALGGRYLFDSSKN